MKYLFVYLLIIFALQAVSIVVAPAYAQLYLTAAIVGMGMIAILFQKVIHKQKFVDMGFRLNRNALIGVGIGLTFTLAILLLHYWIPLKLGFWSLTVNPQLPAGEATFADALIIMAAGGAVMFLPVLFGEELAFRGYVLPKMAAAMGSVKAVLLSSAVFALWHLPAYFSVYRGGAAEGGWSAVGIMLFVHGISAIPLCILYLTTRDLYGVSLYHTLADVFQYSVVSSSGFGAASQGALYTMTVLNPSAFAAYNWSLYGVDILVMGGLCLLAAKSGRLHQFKS